MALSPVDFLAFVEKTPLREGYRVILFNTQTEDVILSENLIHPNQFEASLQFAESQRAITEKTGEISIRVFDGNLHATATRSADKKFQWEEESL